MDGNWISGSLEDYILQPRHLQDQPWSRVESKNADASPISHFFNGTVEDSEVSKYSGIGYAGVDHD